MAEPSLTWEELIALTTIQTCKDCCLDHALARSCEDALLYAEQNSFEGNDSDAE